MPLTSIQLPTLKDNILANTTLIDGVAMNLLPRSADNDLKIANWYNLIRSPDYWAWRTNISRAELYHSTSSIGTTWNWATYKAQNVTEQNAWSQMFMGDTGPIGLVNFRAGIAAIFNGAGAPTDQRNHCLAAGRRLVRNIEHLFITAVVAPPANTGNDGIPGNRGTITNPDNLGYDGICSPTDVERALALP
jgi:hypothetical protein